MIAYEESMFVIVATVCLAGIVFAGAASPYNVGAMIISLICAGVLVFMILSILILKVVGFFLEVREIIVNA